MIEAELADGRILEFPDGTDPNVIQATVKKMLGQAGPSGAAGVAAEIAKGLPRGAGDTAKMIPEGLTRMLPPVLGQAARAGLEALSAPARRLVAPSPQNEAERMAATGSEIAGSVLAGGPGATVRQAAINTALPTVGGVVGEQLGGETGKTIGAIAPGAVQLAAAPVGHAVAKKVGEAVETFKKAGTAPTVGQATESGFIRGLENLIAKFPGGVGVMRKFADEQQANLGASARTGVSAEDAGRAIEKGIKGEGGFIDRFKSGQDSLYNKLDAHIPKHEPINVVNTTRALTTINEGVPGAPNISQFFINSKMKGIEGALADDLKQASVSGALPYEAVKKLRTLVGRELADATIASSVPKSKWKALYGALSEDLGAAATAKGPQAEQAWSRANQYTKAGLDRIESVLERTVGNTPEETFAKFMPKDPDQANKARAVLRSLTSSERQVVSEAVVNRLGRATPSKQNEVGEVFSTETFLTNWNKLSDGAKAQIFPNHSMREQINSIAKVSSNIREGSKTFANPSGTAGAAAPYGLGAMAFTGNLGAAAGLIGSAYIGGKMLTSQKVVEWLAKAPNIRPENMAPHLARLGVIYNQTGDPGLKSELEQYITSINGQQK